MILSLSRLVISQRLTLYSLQWNYKATFGHGMRPFVGIHVINKSTCINTKVFVKPTNTSRLVTNTNDIITNNACSTVLIVCRPHGNIFQTWAIDCKMCLLSSNDPESFINGTINRFVREKSSPNQVTPYSFDAQKIARVTLSFEDQQAANLIRRQL